MRANRLIFLLLLAVAMTSCKAVSSLIHDGEVVAKLGLHKLYLSELESVIPDGVSSEDSTNLANQYIESWARNKAFLDKAEQFLSKEEKDVSDDLEAYRQSLLRYRYEQHYINERLDTTVSDKEIAEYYEAHQESFRLDRPILKARFLNIAKDSPNLPVIRRLMSSDKVEDVVAADSIAFNSTQHYHDFSDKWVDAVTLAAEFGVDYVQMLANKNGSFIEIPDGETNVSVAYVVSYVGSGETAPLDYCEEKIRDIIISSRKHKLLTTLEQDLIEDAKSKDNFVIYSE